MTWGESAGAALAASTVDCGLWDYGTGKAWQDRALRKALRFAHFSTSGLNDGQETPGKMAT